VLEKAWQLPEQASEDRQKLIGVLVAYAAKLANEDRLDEALSISPDGARQSEEFLAL